MWPVQSPVDGGCEVITEESVLELGEQICGGRCSTTRRRPVAISAHVVVDSPRRLERTWNPFWIKQVVSRSV